MVKRQKKNHVQMGPEEHSGIILNWPRKDPHQNSVIRSSDWLAIVGSDITYYLERDP